MSDVDDAAGLIDAAVEAGANQVSGPGMSSSNAEELYRQALAKAVDDARAPRYWRRPPDAPWEGSHRSSRLRRDAAPYAERTALDASTPVVPGQQETTATVSVTFSLR